MRRQCQNLTGREINLANGRICYPLVVEKTKKEEKMKTKQARLSRKLVTTVGVLSLLGILAMSYTLAVAQEGGCVDVSLGCGGGANCVPLPTSLDPCGTTGTGWECAGSCGSKRFLGFPYGPCGKPLTVSYC